MFRALLDFCLRNKILESQETKSYAVLNRLHIFCFLEESFIDFELRTLKFTIIFFKKAADNKRKKTFSNLLQNFIFINFLYFIAIFFPLIYFNTLELVPVIKRPQQQQPKVSVKTEKSASLSIVQKVPEQQTSMFSGEEKKIIKPNHPRIKYSRHKNPVFIATQPQIQSQTQVQQPVRTTQVLSDGKKIEYISVTTVKPAEPIAKPIIVPAANNTQQYVIQAVATTGGQAVTEYEVSAANTSNQSNDFPNEMMDDLEYGIDDIELPEDVQIHFSDSYKSEDTDREKKYYATVSDNNSMASDGEEAGRQYECRHCGKRYRWKSTLRRHENVECGGKEACHECPYCNYKAKQRGNLGVHIRKHHGDKPPLETRRNKKGVQTL